MSNPLGRAIPLALAIGTLAAAASVAAPGDAAGRAAEPVMTTLPATADTLVCPPAPAVAEGVGKGSDPSFAAQPVASKISERGTTYTGTGAQGALSARTLPGDGKGKTTAGSTTGVPQVSGGGSEPLAVTAAPADGQARTAAALTTTLTTDGDLTGLAASSCGPARASQWLVGGGVETGRTTRIVLSNPGETAASVSLTVLTGKGATLPAAAQDVVVAGGASTSLLLQALITDDGPVAIGVTAAGGRIAASLVDARLDGLTPKGVEQISSSLPSEQQVLTPLAGKITLRLANPGAETAQVSWRVLGSDGTVASVEDSGAAVPRGSVVEVPVTMPAGGAALVVSAKTPVLASATIVRSRAGGAADEAVVTAGQQLGSSTLVQPAGSGKTTIALTAGEQPATVVVRQVDSKAAPVTPDQTLAIPADSVGTVTVPAGVAVVELSVRGGQVHGGVLIEDGPGGQFVAATQVQPGVTGDRQLQISVRG